MSRERPDQTMRLLEKLVLALTAAGFYLTFNNVWYHTRQHHYDSASGFIWALTPDGAFLVCYLVARVLKARARNPIWEVWAMALLAFLIMVVANTVDYPDLTDKGYHAWPAFLAMSMFHIFFRASDRPDMTAVTTGRDRRKRLPPSPDETGLLSPSTNGHDPSRALPEGRSYLERGDIDVEDLTVLMAAMLDDGRSLADLEDLSGSAVGALFDPPKGERQGRRLKTAALARLREEVP